MDVIKMPHTPARFVALGLGIALVSLSLSCADDAGSPIDINSTQVVTRGALAWQPMTSSTAELLWSVWSGKDDVIAVGTRGSANHLVADAWTAKPSGVEVSLCDVRVSPRNTLKPMRCFWSRRPRGSSHECNAAIWTLALECRSAARRAPFCRLREKEHIGRPA